MCCESLSSSQRLRGPGGGYKLGRPGDAISVADVIDAVNETVDATRCGGLRNCRGEQRCLTHDLWEELSCQIRDFLSNVSLTQLVERKSVQTLHQLQEQPDHEVMTEVRL